MTPSPCGQQRLAADRLARLTRVGHLVRGKLIDAHDIGAVLERLLEPGDRVCIEGNNQKQADFLAAALATLDPRIIHGLHMVQSVLALPAHLDVFERGIANRLDFSFAGPQSRRLALLLRDGKLSIGAIHTYLELFSRYFIDLTPRVSLICAEAADSVVRSPKPNHIEPLFTRDPAQISEIQILMAMLVIKGIYSEYQVERLNHGIGFATAAIELLLPTYAVDLGLQGTVPCTLTECTVRLRGTTPAICSSAPPCKSTWRATVQLPQLVVSPALAARRTWVAMHADEDMSAAHG